MILTEALAQTAGIAGAWGSSGRHFLLSAIRNMKFPAAARPEEQVILNARKTGEIGGLWMFDVRAEVEGTHRRGRQIVLNEMKSAWNSRATTHRMRTHGRAAFDILVAIGSLLAGVIGALIGLGGGVIITPLLVLAFGVDIRYAMGAALVFSDRDLLRSRGRVSARWDFEYAHRALPLRRDHDRRGLRRAACRGARPGGALRHFRSCVACHGPAFPQKEEGSVRSRCLGSSGGEATATRHDAGLRRGPSAYTVHHVVPGFAVMWVAGVLSGLLGIGSGAFKVVAMDQIMRIPFKVTTATSNFMIGVTAAASVGVYLKRGYLDPALVAPVALGVLAGAFVGAKLLPVAPVKLLRAIFLTAVSVIAVQMIARGLHINF